MCGMDEDWFGRAEQPSTAMTEGAGRPNRRRSARRRRRRALTYWCTWDQNGGSARWWPRLVRAASGARAEEELSRPPARVPGRGCARPELGSGGGRVARRQRMRSCSGRRSAAVLVGGRTTGEQGRAASGLGWRAGNGGAAWLMRWRGTMTGGGEGLWWSKGRSLERVEDKG
ncbi:uncharacterized protein A4U43_C07F8210 [Asparagus officinalis]|uniref:Uncharacterized protein n=1 Tax=Asparagus officinalis TaxID=4686 RepID=A0A5P1EAF0_ASPOF|nr:uncharacterized protein A4U43_C07F8210 [Asparagus officinalis]